MQFSNSILKVIPRRSSCRTYLPQLLEPPIKESLLTVLNAKHQSPIGGKVRFELIEMEELDSKEKKRLGTYGFIKGAQYFIVATIQPSTHALENLGYVMEKIILFATDLGLGTCWVGGYFKRSNFASKIRISPSRVPVISPVGYPSKKHHFIGKLAKLGARSKYRKPWITLFFEGDLNTPLNIISAGKYAEALEMVRLGPSAANRQPWRVIKEPGSDKYHFFVHRKKKKKFKFPDLQRVDLGIAICHFDLTIQELELKGKWNFIKPNLRYPDSFEYIASWQGH
jgi:hypothetical protein